MPVALFTRAWIEIALTISRPSSRKVALFTRAWIEIEKGDKCATNKLGRPLHEGVD